MSIKHFSPLRYPGGKNCIFPFMSKFFYENNILGIPYAEPYAGGAGLAFHLLLEGYVEKIYINGRRAEVSSQNNLRGCSS